jgi:hypothetical protein
MESTSIRRDIWAGLKWLAKACLALIIIGTLLLPLILLTLPDIGSKPLTVPAGLSVSWLTLVGVVVSLSVVYVGWRIIKAVVLYPFGSWNVFGATTSARLVGLGITAIIAPRAVEKLVMIPATLLFRLIDRLTRQAGNVPMSIAPSPSDRVISIQEPLIRLGLMVLDVVAEAGRALGQAIEGLFTPDVVIALAIWVVVGSLLSTAVPVQGETPSVVGASRLYQYVKAMSAAQRHGIVLTTVFLIGAYLSIAAIVAIPWLHEEKVSPGLSREGLEKILNGIMPTAKPIPEPVKPGSPQDDPLAPLSEYLSKREKPAGAFDMAAFSLNATIADGKDARIKAIARLQQMPFEISQRAAQMRQAAISAFELETATLMSNQERGYFMREIQRSVSSDYLKLEGALNNCTNALVELDKQLRQFGQTSMAILSVEVPPNMPENARASDQQMRFALLAQPIDIASRATRALRDACETPQIQQTVYTPPVAGSGWGPFGLVARWLLQTKSLPLALITGMLGFGLLGSAIATFVRGGTERGQVSLAAEVTSVLVRGLSAAVVVFLAVKGGLAIFSTGDSEPNAYVVFLTCLVGAVFSEDVWTWARSKFLENLSSKASQAKGEPTMAEAIEGSAAVKTKAAPASE